MGTIIQVYNNILFIGIRQICMYRLEVYMLVYNVFLLCATSLDVPMCDL